MTSAASWTRALISSADSSLAFFVVTSPRTAALPAGKYFNGSKSPERSVSYSSYTGVSLSAPVQDGSGAHVERVHIERVEHLDSDARITALRKMHATLYGSMLGVQSSQRK